MNPAPVLAYIHENWPRSFYHDAPGTGFGGMDLPFPYTSPCIRGEGKFSFFFYWDTYFTNVGLLRSGHRDMAAHNLRNMLWFIARQGYMPNHTAILNRSQPPYLACMVAEYHAATGDDALVAEAAPTLRQEFHFWTTARHTPTGLQRHGHHETAAGCARFYDQVRGRVGLPVDAPDDEKTRIGGHLLAEAETGWDFNPRFEGRCDEHAPVDLNALLATYETFLAEVGPRLGWDDRALWERRASDRRERIDRLHWDADAGWYFDYDFVHARRSPVMALSGIMPLFAGIASPEQAARVAANLPRLEREHGIAVTAELPGVRRHQWAFPNVWPPLVYLAVQGLRRYGHHADARRIAEKFVRTTVELFETTGQLWEKTDAETGHVAGGEYEAAPMLGWTAGTFLSLTEYLASSAPSV